MAPRLAPNDIAAVAHAFARLSEVDAGFGMLPERRTGWDSSIIAPVRFDTVEGFDERIRELAALTGHALTVLKPLAPH